MWIHAATRWFLPLARWKKIHSAGIMKNKKTRKLVEQNYGKRTANLIRNLYSAMIQNHLELQQQDREVFSATWGRLGFLSD